MNKVFLLEHVKYSSKLFQRGCFSMEYGTNSVDALHAIVTMSNITVGSIFLLLVKGRL